MDDVCDSLVGQCSHLMAALVLSLPHLKPSALTDTNTRSATHNTHRHFLPKILRIRATRANHVPSVSTEGEGLTSLMFLPEAHALVAPSPQVDQLEAVVTATAEQLAVVGADVQRGDFTRSRKFLNAAEGPA